MIHLCYFTDFGRSQWYQCDANMIPIIMKKICMISNTHFMVAFIIYCFLSSLSIAANWLPAPIALDAHYQSGNIFLILSASECRSDPSPVYAPSTHSHYLPNLYVLIECNRRCLISKSKCSDAISCTTRLGTRMVDRTVSSYTIVGNNYCKIASVLLQ